MDIKLERLIFAASILQLLLAFRSKHTMGILLGVQTSGYLASKYFGVDYSLYSQFSPGTFVEKGAAFVILAWILLLLLIRLSTLFPTPAYVNHFPIIVSKPQGCTRVARDFSYRAKLTKGENPLLLSASPDVIREIVKKWLQSQKSTTIVTSTPEYMYAQCLTFFMGFPDNVAIRIQPVSGGNNSDKKQQLTAVDIQAESILGRSDLLVNQKRVQDFIKFVNDNLKKDK